MVDVRDRTYQVIVLRARDYREQDRLLTVAAAESGPEAVIARGARKPGHGLAACAQPFCRATVTLSPAKNGVSFLKEGRQEESYLPALGDVERFAYLSYFSELLQASWPENRPEPGLYALARAAFLMVKLGDDLRRTACGHARGAGDGRRFRLYTARGQLLCAHCAETPGPDLSPGALLAMSRLREAALNRVAQLKLSEAQNAEIERALEPYLSYHLDYAGRAKAVLKELL